MQMFLANLLSCSAAMSIISLVYIAVTPHLSKRYSTKWLYYIWLLVVFGWVFPFRPNLNVNIIPYQIPNMEVTQSGYIVFGREMDIVNNVAKETSSIPIWLVITCIWALGAAGILGYHAWRHHRFLKMVNRWSEDITNQELLHILDDLKIELNIKKQVGLKTCLSISTPMMIGFVHSTILLPSAKIDPDELIYILRHELIHLKRNDLWYKTLVLLATAIHWFNPVIYFMARAIEIQCEISCDELLVKETSIKQRKQYGETLIGAIRNGVKIHTALSTDFLSPGRVINTRIFRIMDTTRKSAGVIILCLAFTAVIGSGIAYASNSTYDYLKKVQIINVDVEKLEEGNIICFEGPYQLEAGDIIQYDITSDNNKSLYVDVIRKDTIKYGESIRMQNFIGYYLGFPNCKVTIRKGFAGEYCLLVKFLNLEGASNIKGTIKIIKGKENN